MSNTMSNTMLNRRAVAFVDQPRSASVQRDIDRIIKAELKDAFREGARYTAQYIKDGSLKFLLANVDNHGLGDFEFREIVKGVFDLMDRDLGDILEEK